MAKTCSWNITRGKCVKREFDEGDTDVILSEEFEKAVTDALEEISPSHDAARPLCLCKNPIHHIVEATLDATGLGHYVGGQTSCECYSVTSTSTSFEVDFNLYDHCVCSKPFKPLAWVVAKLGDYDGGGHYCECWNE